MMQKKHKRINILKSFALAGAVLVLFGQAPRAYSSDLTSTGTYQFFNNDGVFAQCIEDEGGLTERSATKCGDDAIDRMTRANDIGNLQNLRRAATADSDRGDHNSFVIGTLSNVSSVLTDRGKLSDRERDIDRGILENSNRPAQRPTVQSTGSGNANQCPIQVNPLESKQLSGNPAKWGGHSRFDQCLDWAGQDRKGGGDYPLRSFASEIANSHLPYIKAHGDIKRYFNRPTHGEQTSQNCLKPIEDGYNALATKFRNVTLCMSLFHMLPSQNFEDDDMTTRNSVTTKSGDGKIVCRSQGVLTKDYQQCKKVVNTYNAALIANVGLQGYQVLDQDHSMNKATQRIMQDESASTTGALQAQEEQLRKAADHTFQRAIFHGAKGATLYTLARGIPDHEDVYNICMQSNLANDLERAKNYFHQVLNTVQYGAQGEQIHNPETQAGLADLKRQKQEQIASMATQEEACRYAVYQRHGLNFLVLNSQARESVMALTMEQAVQAGLNLAHQNMLKKQADQVRGAIDRVEDFNPVPPPVVYDDLMLTACEHDPTLPECLPTSGGRQNVIRDGDQFSFGGFGGGTSGARINDDMDSGFEYDGGSGRDFDRNQDPLVGSSIAGRGGSGGLGNTPGAGSAEYGDGSGGGGGGAGVGGASAPAGGGAAGHDAEGRPNPGGPVSAGNEPTFDGGSGFRLGGGSGLSRVRRNNNESSDNPFSNLFGEDRRSGEVLNYRNPAELGGKDGSIFQMISTRYQDVSQQDRLIEYEIRP